MIFHKFYIQKFEKKYIQVTNARSEKLRIYEMAKGYTSLHFHRFSVLLCMQKIQVLLFWNFSEYFYLVVG